MNGTTSPVELLVMRHAKSAWNTGHVDFDRPLSGRGERDAPKMANWLAERDLKPDLLISSAAERARATAQAVIERCELADEQFEFRRSLYGADARDWLTVLRDEDDNAPRVLICGHNPGLDELLELIVEGELPYTFDGKLMTTAAVAHLRIEGGWEALGPGSATLVTLQRPRKL